MAAPATLAKGWNNWAASNIRSSLSTQGKFQFRN
jgi:hypothetical protein